MQGYCDSSIAGIESEREGGTGGTRGEKEAR